MKIVARFVLVRICCTRLLAACALLAVGALHARAQSDTVPHYRFRLLGVFSEMTGNPIPGAKVSSVLGHMSTVTGPTGIVSLIFLAEGENLVRLQRLGYEPQTFMVNIAPSDTAPLTMMMRPLTTLQAMITTATTSTLQSRKLTGFLEREKSHAEGYFIDSTVIDKSGAYELANLLVARAPGVLTISNQGRTYLAGSARCRDGTAHGPPQVFVDGVPMTSDFVPDNGGGKATGDMAPFNLEEIPVSDLAGIEWYSDNTTTPMEFSSMSKRCGALLLWTKR
ncbi:MAG TPA: hypothetical protein VGM67_13895 [Gemmatimonadaceae bacterium]|jgi:hypothetical protein